MIFIVFIVFFRLRWSVLRSIVEVRLQTTCVDLFRGIGVRGGSCSMTLAGRSLVGARVEIVLGLFGICLGVVDFFSMLRLQRRSRNYRLLSFFFLRLFFAFYICDRRLRARSRCYFSWRSQFNDSLGFGVRFCYFKFGGLLGQKYWLLFWSLFCRLDLHRQTTRATLSLTTRLARRTHFFNQFAFIVQEFLFLGDCLLLPLLINLSFRPLSND